MPFLDQTVKFINDSLKASSLNNQYLQNCRLEGISTIVGRERVEGQIEFFPAIVTGGEIKLVEPDDKHAVIIYHKLISKVYSFQKKSYGDDYDIIENAEMAMVVYLNTKRGNTTAEKLEPALIIGLPFLLPPAQLFGMTSCLITPTSSDLDQIRVFRQEYQQTIYFLKPADNLFIIRYRVVSSFDRNCLKNCQCG